MLRGLRQSITAHSQAMVGPMLCLGLVTAMTGCMPASHLAYEQTLTTTLPADNERNTIIAAAFGLDDYETSAEAIVVAAGMFE